MAIQKHTRRSLSPEQARSQIVAGLPDLSREALNELVVFVEFLHFRKHATGQLEGGAIQPSTDIDADLSSFAGMLSDLTPEEMQRFDDAVKRRPLFAGRTVDL